MVCYHLKDVDIIVIMFDITNVISNKYFII
jgi:hypothetical protein